MNTNEMILSGDVDAGSGVVLRDDPAPCAERVIIKRLPNVVLKAFRQAMRGMDGGKDGFVARGISHTRMMDEIFAHGQRTAWIATRIGRVMGLNDERVELLGVATVLHDVGKILVPLAIQFKPGPLTVREFATMQSHAQSGKELIEGALATYPSAHVKLLADVALLHHERWDGLGYPHRLRRDAIPLFARIAAVADVFDALASPRCYKPAWPVQRAMYAVVKERSRQFDPDCVEAFHSLLPEVVVHWEMLERTAVANADGASTSPA